MDFLLFIGLLVVAVPFVLPIVSWVSARRTRARVAELSEAVAEQSAAIDLLKAQLLQLRRQARDGSPDAPASEAGKAAAPIVSPAPAVSLAATRLVSGPTREPPGTTPTLPVPAAATSREVPPLLPPTPHLPAAVVPPSPPATGPASDLPPRPPAVVPSPIGAPREQPVQQQPRDAQVRPGVSTPAPVHAAARSADASAPPRSADASVPPRRPRPPEPPPIPPRPPGPPAPAFDWESLVGVKLFSGIAGIALVVAAVFFLKYSVEHGWLQPPIRVLIGIIVAVGLLVVCEMKAARRYPVTANALDAAAIAILFATFFAAHALWNLIPSSVTFVLLGMVTAVAVLLSIRRESMFIAVLGLLGGFATPAMLSSGQNQPIPLFAYLMLLNVGLAWVAYRRTWPVLTALTLVFTTIYQWGWVYRFLGQSELTLAMGIFLIFPLATFAGLVLARRKPPTGGAADADVMFERTAVAAAALPLLFAVYLSAVPAYGNRPWLLFGFLLLIDAGLFAVAIARGRGLLHSVGAIATLLVMALWLAVSYSHAGANAALVFCAVFVTFYALADAVAARFGRPFEEGGAAGSYAAPLLLFVPAVLARIEPAFAAPLPIFGTLLPLVLLIGWRAIVTERGALYYIAAFFAVATQASWSSAHLTTGRLRTAVLIYAIFGVVSMAVPFIARRVRRPLEPEGGGGAVLIASLGLLLFLSTGPIAPAALWALALLLAIINAGLFVESAAGGLPLISIAGSLVSWVVLGSWWLRAAATVGVLPSLTVLTILTLITLGGHAWTNVRTHHETPAAPASVSGGLYLGLIGHLFLMFIAINREWALPPWPWLATLAVLSLAASTVSLVIRSSMLHAAAIFAGALVIAAWTYATGAPPWGLVSLAAAAVASAYALVWMPIASRRAHDSTAPSGAVAVLFVGEATALLAVACGGAPPFAAVAATHVVNLAILLALSWRQVWPPVSLWAVVAASAAAFVQWQAGDLATGWVRLLALSFAMYAVFIAYPLILGRRAQRARAPFIAAVLASAMCFFAARVALNAGGYAWMVGALPVFEGAVMALLLRQLLRIEPQGQRDLGRLALIAGASLAFVTVAIPLQLRQQWVTIGWALEGAALAWLFRRIPHRGLLSSAAALFAAVFVRLALNPDVLQYEQRGSMRILNWYLYAYLLCAAAFLIAAWWLSTTDDRIPGTPLRPSRLLPAGAVILLFLLLNIEIADFYAVGPSIMFRFGVTVSQDLTYTIGWLLFGMVLLAACIYLHNKAGRVTALALIAVTTFKCFLYDFSSLGGLYRVGSFVGLAMSLALVSLALQKYVLAKPEAAR